MLQLPLVALRLFLFTDFLLLSRHVLLLVARLLALLLVLFVLFPAVIVVLRLLVARSVRNRG